jgi:hypothetical protein
MIIIIGRGYQHKGGWNEASLIARDYCKVYINPRQEKKLSGSGQLHHNKINLNKTPIEV